MSDMIEAVRKDEKVGRGSCSTIDECYTDAELMELLEDEGATTPEEALKVAYEFEGLQLEQALNTRWGEDSDPELETYNKFFED